MGAERIGTDMNPRVFLDEVVRPNMADALDAPDSQRQSSTRFSRSTPWSASSMRTWWRSSAWRLASWDDDTVFRGKLVKKEPAYEVLRDAAFALKHGRLKSQERQVRRASDTRMRTCASTTSVSTTSSGAAQSRPLRAPCAMRSRRHMPC